MLSLWQGVWCLSASWEKRLFAIFRIWKGIFRSMWQGIASEKNPTKILKSMMSEIFLAYPEKYLKPKRARFPFTPAPLRYCRRVCRFFRKNSMDWPIRIRVIVSVMWIWLWIRTSKRRLSSGQKSSAASANIWTHRALWKWKRLCWYRMPEEPPPDRLRRTLMHWMKNLSSAFLWNCI